MAGGQSVSVGESLRTLWAAGAIGGADDGALIDRFSERRDDIAEAAFRVLVERHGPMVLRVCRQLIHDGHAAEEAAQAVFLILARKAGSIRVRTTLAPWLYGVSRRVAARARVRAAARHARDERTVRAVVARRTDGDPTETPHEPDWEVVHEEVGRLPEKYRTPVVLCYFEALTYEEAARRIGCPVGTVRVRLSRARERLRARLTRRGFGGEPLAAVGWLADGVATSGLLAPAPGPVTAWVDATLRAIPAHATGRATAAGVVPALALADEVIKGLAMSQMKFAVIVLTALGATSAAAVGLASGGRGQGVPSPPRDLTPGAAATTPPARKEVPPTLKEVPEPVDVMLPKLMERRLHAAAQRLDAQRAYYEEGRITIDRFLQALDLFYQAQMEKARTREERILAAQKHLELVAEVLKREEAELRVGRGTVADTAEAQLAHELAAIEWAKAHQEPMPGDVAALRKRIDKLEQQLEQVRKRVERRGDDPR